MQNRSLRSRPAPFSPLPDVFSTVLRLDFAPRFSELHVDPEGFNRFLRGAFAQKRKTLANNLRAMGYTPVALTTAWPATIPLQARSEAVPLDAMADLYRALHPLQSSTNRMAWRNVALTVDSEQKYSFLNLKK